MPNTTRPIRIGFQLQPEHASYPTIRRVAAEAEDLGADVIFTWDHFFPLFGDPDGRHFECWTLLAALAESTSRVALGPLVTCAGYRNPDLLADMARTVDHISAGRLILGVGSGWCERDFVEYGYEYGTVGNRIDTLAAALPRIEARLAKLNPAPPGRIPVLIGGGGERRTLKLVAEHADIWHDFGDPDSLRRKLPILAKHCTEAGRDPDAIEISAGVGGRPVPDGDPESLGGELRELGVSLFTVGADGPDFDLGLLRRWIDWRDNQSAGSGD